MILNTAYVSQQERRKFEECIEGTKCLKLHLTLSHIIPNACPLCELNVGEDIYNALWNEMVDSNTADLRVPTPIQVFNHGRDLSRK
jgi:hypothetical protein